MDEAAQAPVEEIQIQLHGRISLYDDTHDSKYDPKIVFGETGEAECNGFQVTFEEMAEGTTQEELNQYISLLRELRKENLTGLCFGSVGNAVVVERYDWTLKEYLNNDECRDTFWDKIDADYGTSGKLSTDGTYRMSATLQQLLKTLITKICVMLQNNWIFDLHSENVVFNSHHFEPRFTRFKIATGKRNVHLWTGFSEIVKEIIEKGPVNLHPEVKDFFDMIEANAGCNREVLKQHPALISEYKKYMFLVRIQEMFESGNGYAYERDCAGDFANWEKDLKSHWPFGMKVITEHLENGGDGGKETEGFEPHVRYIYCMLNLREYVCRSGHDLDLPIKKLIRAFDGVHPTFASYVFRRYVSGKRVIGDQLGIKIDDLTFTVFHE